MGRLYQQEAWIHLEGGRDISTESCSVPSCCACCYILIRICNHSHSLVEQCWWIWTKEARWRSFVFNHQNGSGDITWKPARCFPYRVPLFPWTLIQYYLTDCDLLLALSIKGEIVLRKWQKQHSFNIQVHDIDFWKNVFCVSSHRSNCWHSVKGQLPVLIPVPLSVITNNATNSNRRQCSFL